MWNWLKRKPPKAAEVRLLAMRLADMYKVHPNMDRSHVCSICAEPVGLYPSGQSVLKRYKNVIIVCHVCQTWNADFTPAPGSLDEIRESITQKDQ
jgi:hypothetical protein